MAFLKNAQKRTKTKTKAKRKKSRVVGGWVWDLANARGGPSNFFGRLLVQRPAPRALASPEIAQLKPKGVCYDPRWFCLCLNPKAFARALCVF
jgi:hypothetical protein